MYFALAMVYAYLVQDLEVRRRYSEFASLRQTLVNLHPTLIVPPIPEKHSMADYAAKPTKAKEDAGMIDLRKRMLAVFLNRCRRMKEVREDGVWWRFLDPNVSWVCKTSSKCRANLFRVRFCTRIPPLPCPRTISRRLRLIPHTLRQPMRGCQSRLRLLN